MFASIWCLQMWRSLSLLRPRSPRPCLRVSAFLLLHSSMFLLLLLLPSSTVIQDCPDNNTSTHTRTHSTHWRLYALDPASCCPAAGRSVGERCGFGTFCSVRARVRERARDQSVSRYARLHPLFLWMSSCSAISPAVVVVFQQCSGIAAVSYKRTLCGSYNFWSIK